MKLTSVVITMEARDERDVDFGLPPKILTYKPAVGWTISEGHQQLYPRELKLMSELQQLVDHERRHPKRPERRTEGDANGCQKED